MGGSGGGGEEAHSPPGPDVDDEESMDWWTKYFASVDAMIEASEVALQLRYIQGVRKFPPQLCQSLASSYVDRKKYPLNHVIYTSREFF